MPSYVIRIELYGHPSQQTITEINDKLLFDGFLRTIYLDEIECWLPSWEYIIASLSTADQIRTRVYFLIKPFTEDFGLMIIPVGAEVMYLSLRHVSGDYTALQ